MTRCRRVLRRRAALVPLALADVRAALSSGHAGTGGNTILVDIPPVDDAADGGDFFVMRLHGEAIFGGAPQ